MVFGNAVPPLVEYVIFTFAMVPVVVHVMVWFWAMFQASPPFGPVSVNSALILKLASERSKAVASAESLIRTLASAVIVSGMVQAYVPEFGVKPTMISGKVPPPSVEYSSFTLLTLPALNQVIVWLLPTIHCSPP